MNRNDVAEIRDLKIGDRFYKAGDKDKTVYEKVEHDTKITKYQTYSHWGAIDGMDKFPCAFKSDTMVVFLRNKTEQHVEK